MNESRTSCFSIELARIRVSNALTFSQNCFKLRRAAIPQAATLARDELGISVGRTTVWTWIDQGKLRAVRGCGRWFIPRDVLEAILSGQKAGCPWPLTAQGTEGRIAAPVEGPTQRPAMSCSMPFDQVGRS